MQPKAENYTEKAWEAIVLAKDIAKERKQQQIETEHLLLSLIKQNDLGIKILIEAGGSIENIEKELRDKVNDQPIMNTSPENLYLSKSLIKVLIESEEQKNTFKDKYISVEHLILSLAEDNRCCKRILGRANINKVEINKAISKIRGSQKVKNQNPENLEYQGHKAR